MASRIQPRNATPATTGISCLAGVMAWILIGSIYVNNTAGWPQFALSVVSAATVCLVAASMLVYAVYQQYVVKHSLFADPAGRGHDFDYRSTGQWAIVTGATDGIGKEYARQLAANYGMDVVLVGRNPDKLRAVAELIRKECGGLERRVTTVVADFAEDPVVPARGGRCCGAAADETKEVADNNGGDDKPAEQRRTEEERVQDGEDDEDSMLDDVGDRCFCHHGRHRHRRCTRWYPRLRAVVECRSRASGGGVGVLINCAGVCYPHPEYFAGMSGRADDGGRGGGSGGDGVTHAEFTADFCDNADAAVRCNVAAAVHACRLVLPGMLARGRGLIVNVGSAAASIPPAAPLMTLYAATKKFLEKLSADLDAECAYLTRDRVNDDDSSYGVRVQCARPAYVATAMLRSANPDVRAVSGDDDDCGSDGDDQCWWAAQKKRVEDGVQRWMVPSARRWVRSALRRGGRLYARGATGGPANFTGYWPHTLLVWCGRLANALTPRRWFINHVLIPAMLVYRAKGRKKSWEERNTVSDGRKTMAEQM